MYLDWPLICKVIFQNVAGDPWILIWLGYVRIERIEVIY
jgi:hypothetical protein